MLIKAVHDAARELAARRYTTAPLDDDEPMPDEPVIMVSVERATKGPYLDDKRPTPDEIRAFDGTYLDIAAADELWAAFAINTVNGTRYVGLGRTAGEAKACAWVNSHWPGGTTSVSVRGKILTNVPDGWTFELYPPPKPNPKMLAISSRAIFERVRLTIPNVTLEEVQDTIMQSLPYMGDAGNEKATR
jgi:hypothetical protein